MRSFVCVLDCILDLFVIFTCASNSQVSVTELQKDNDKYYSLINGARGPYEDSNICFDIQGVWTERSEVHAP